MTATPRAFRFGVLSPAADAASWLRDAREAEARGYSTLVLTDHLDLSGAHVTRLAWVPAKKASSPGWPAMKLGLYSDWSSFSSVET